MASIQFVFICAALATVLWTSVGLWLSSRLLPPSLAWPTAPALGWAVHSVVALPIFCLTGMGRSTVTATIILSICLGCAGLLKGWHRRICPGASSERVPLVAIVGAMLLSGIVTAAILPTVTLSGVALAPPIFDHSKVAIIDGIVRLGVPADNPFFGGVGITSRLSYYYLWHLSAAELSIVTGCTGWEADAGLSWFTAFSSLMLMMGFANWLSGCSTAAKWVLVLATATSIRIILVWLVGARIAEDFTGEPSGFGAWLFQVTWAPQHVASAGCILLSTFFLGEIARKPTYLLTLVFALVAAAGFESSTWIGGVTFPLSAIAIAVSIFIQIENKARIYFVTSLGAGALLAAVIATPFIYDQAMASMSRASGSPIGIMPYDVLGEEVPPSLRAMLDLPAYWSVFLFVEFAAFYPAGFIMMNWLRQDRAMSSDRRTTVLCFGLLAIISLAVGSVLISKIGSNNDLAWRGVLPAVLALIVGTAAGTARYLSNMRPLFAVAIVAPIGLGCMAGLKDGFGNIYFEPQASAEQFAKSAKMWTAVRAQSQKNDRVANNPLFLSDMTKWPINISWALLSNRRSCYAGSDLALPFVPLPQDRRRMIDEQFNRIFDGYPEPEDIDQLAGLYDCSVVVLTPQDGAWSRDPFATNSQYRLVETETGAWRIYKRQSPTIN